MALLPNIPGLPGLDSTPLRGFFYDPSNDDANAQAGINRGYKAYDQLSPVDYQDVNYVGPEEAMDVRVNPVNVERVGNTAMGDVAVDPQYKAQQLAQLSALQELRDKGGFNLTDRANLNQIQNQESAAVQAQKNAIMQNAQMRGMGGSGMELMAMLNANQGSANRQSQKDMEIAGMAQDRALQAGNSAAGLAGNMSAQDFQQQSAVAQARDAAAQFNARMANDMGQFNNTQDLRAQTVNQQKSQGVNNSRADAANNSQTMNKYTMPTANFSQRNAKATGIAKVGDSQADYYGRKSDAAQRAQGGLWGGGLEMGSGIAKSLMGGGGGGGIGNWFGGGDPTPSSSNMPSNQSQPFSDAGNYEDPAQPFDRNNSRSNYVETDQSDPYDSVYRPRDNYVEMAHGGVVPGRAQVPGDSPQNDTVKAMLSPGEVVVPRSVSTDPRKEAMLAALMNLRKKHGGM